MASLPTALHLLEAASVLIVISPLPGCCLISQPSAQMELVSAALVTFFGLDKVIHPAKDHLALSSHMTRVAPNELMGT